MFRTIRIKKETLEDLEILATRFHVSKSRALDLAIRYLMLTSIKQEEFAKLVKINPMIKAKFVEIEEFLKLVREGAFR